MSIRLPVGSYIVTAKAVMTNVTPAAVMTCVLAQTGVSSALDRADSFVTVSAGSDTLVMHAAVQVAGATDGQLRVSCLRSAPGQASAALTQLTAIQAGSITVAPP
jgi:hypothetical protein